MSQMASTAASLDSFVLSPRLLRDRSVKSMVEDEVMQRVKNGKLRNQSVVAGVDSIRKLRDMPKKLKTHRLFSSQSTLSSPKLHSTLEKIESYWLSTRTPATNIDECVAKSLLHESGPALPNSATIPKSLIFYLQQSPLGLEVLRAALKTMPEERLHSGANYTNIMKALKEKRMQQSRMFKIQRRKKAKSEAMLK